MSRHARVVGALISSALLAASVTTRAEPPQPLTVAVAAPGTQTDVLLKRLREAFPASRIDSVAITPIDGVFEVAAGPNIFYTDTTGRYVMFGKLFDMTTRTDLTSARIAEVQRLDTALLTHANAIKQVRGSGARVLYVFADPNCGYCKQLEKTLQSVDNVTVYTYMVPLLGPDSFDKARAIWCSPDRAKAWSDWMLRGAQPKPVAGNCEDPIDINAELGRKYEMPGTPMLITADGRRLMGAVAAAEIDAALSRPPAVAATTTPKAAR